jgi:O-antigen/teichoic acid export membrane protein
MLSMGWNSFSIMANVGITSILGYVFWLVAARLMPAGVVGLASSVISAAMLCGQFSLLGAGSAVVALLPAWKDREVRFLSSTMSITALAGLAAGLVLLAVIRVLPHSLGRLAMQPSYALTVLAMVVAWALTQLLYQTFIALRRSDKIVLRNGVVGLLRIGGIFLLLPLALRSSVIALLLVWLIATIAGVIVAIPQLRGTYGDFHYWWGIDWGAARSVLRVGLPNHVLTLGQLAPGLLLPILVTELLSAELNAYWYVAWMMGTAVLVTAASAGAALFAELADRPEFLRRGIHQAIRLSLILGIPAAAIMILAGGLVLSILGHRYAAEGLAPVRLVALAVLPDTFIEVYVGVCRATNRLREAIATVTLSAAMALAACTVAALAFGSLSAVAGAWLALQILTGIWSMIRLKFISRDMRPGPGDSASRREKAQHRAMTFTRA